MTGPKKRKPSQNFKRGGAKPAALERTGPSKPAGPSRDVRSAQGRGGSKISDAAQVVRRDIGLSDADRSEGNTGRTGKVPHRGPKTPGQPTQGRPTQGRQGQRRPQGAQGQPRGSSTRGAAIGTDLNAPAPDTVFRDYDKQPHTFPDSNLKRVAARILSEKNKPWRYRPFPFPIFTDKGNEQTFYFDFYVYDNMDQILKLILVAPRESAEVWDKIGRFKRQYSMFPYELWTPEKLAQLQKPRAQLGF